MSSKPSKMVDPAVTGIFRGVVLFEGTPPRATTIPVAAFKECANPRPEDEDVLIREGRVQNAFIYVKTGLEDYAFPPAEGEVGLDQKGCLYQPRVIGLQTGQSVAIRNSDPMLHNVHALPKFSRSFNVGMGASAPDLRKTFTEPEVMVPIRCDVHPWMKAYVGVLPHPYFAVTDARGEFELRNVPPGDYTLEAWHERLGQIETSLTLKAGESKAITFSFSPRE